MCYTKDKVLPVCGDLLDGSGCVSSKKYWTLQTAYKLRARPAHNSERTFELVPGQLVEQFPDDADYPLYSFGRPINDTVSTKNFIKVRAIIGRTTYEGWINVNPAVITETHSINKASHATDTATTIANSLGRLRMSGAVTQRGGVRRTKKSKVQSNHRNTLRS